MKNNFKIYILIFFGLFFYNNLFSQEIKIESSEIKVLNEGNLLNASNGVKILAQDGIIIFGDSVVYNKIKNNLKILGNVVYIDNYNNVRIKAEEVFYDKKNEIIHSSGNVYGIIDKKFNVESSNLYFERLNGKIFSNDKTTIIDNLENKILVNSFDYSLANETLFSEELILKDQNESIYKTKNIIINFKNNTANGEKISINLFSSIFGNEKNNPRLIGEKFYFDKNETTVEDATFTSCGIRKKEKCPPWIIGAKEIKHKKKEKVIEYKKAWLKIYDKPILYFPKFFHPDPTVKRRSGFLFPTIKQSSKLGQSVQLPYFKVISENKDLTFTPRIFLDKRLLAQTEYRQVNKNSETITDFSFFKKNNSTMHHLFSEYNTKINKETSLKLKYQAVSNDDYLERYKFKSPLIDSTEILNSSINLKRKNEEYNFSTKVEVIEDLSKPKSDRHEFIYPSYDFSKEIYSEQFDNGNLNFISSGFQKMYNTNVYELININDLYYSSDFFTMESGLRTNYDVLFKNVNSNTENSLTYKENGDQKILSALKFDLSYPMYKFNNGVKNFLSPIISLRYSPNKSNNIKNIDTKIDFDDVFYFNRIGRNETVEGGQSLSYGLEFNRILKDSEIKFGIANVIRDQKNDDLPSTSTINQKQSDFIGIFDYKVNKNFSLKYNYSIDNNFDDTNYNEITSQISLNNFITTFNFIEEDNMIGEESYLQNTSRINFNENHSLNFGTRKNLDKNITEYYNLIYEYQNDCLSAAIEYSKNYYEDSNSGDNFFFTIKLIPISGFSKQKDNK